MHPGEFTDEYPVKPTENATWAQGVFQITIPIKEWTSWKMPQVVVKFYAHDSLIKTSFVRVSRILKEGETENITVDSRIPGAADRISLSGWNPGSEYPVIVREIELKQYR